MDTSKRTARTVGVLFLFINIAFLLGAFAFVEPILGDPDYLTIASEKSTQLILGSLLEISNGVAYIGIAVLMYSVLRGRFQSLALWYVAFRIVEFVMQILSDLSPLALINIGEEFVKAGPQDASAYQSVGDLLVAGRFWAFQMVTIALVLGALVFYYMLYQSKLIPRFISVWGLIAAVLVLATAFLDMFGVSVEGLDFLGALMLLNELFLGVWLIVKGFEPNAVSALSAEQA